MFNLISVVGGTAFFKFRNEFKTLNKSVRMSIVLGCFICTCFASVTVTSLVLTENLSTGSQDQKPYCCCILCT